MDSTHFLEQLEQLFELEAGTLGLANVIDDTPGWSSLTFLGLMAMVDEDYQISLKPRQVHRCTTFSDLYSLIQQLRCVAPVT